MVKNKIIYISGGTDLDKSAIKAAFDEVRQTLGLDSDSLLFGVPLEEEEDCAAPVAAEKPKKVRKAKIEKLEIEEEIILEEPAEEIPEIQQPQRVIPILSVLSGGMAETPAQMPEPVDVLPQIVSIMEISDVLEECLPDPEPQTPQTIEEIFENLTPLPEEKIIESTRADSDDFRDENLDDDATLTKLAAEFVETQKEQDPEPVARSGRMGKLKNILPFKKAKKDDTGMLGDLFGWAGIAANEDDAVTPGFFATR